jgi:hypothetical protein
MTPHSRVKRGDQQGWLTEVVESASKLHSEWWVVEGLTVTVRRTNTPDAFQSIVRAANCFKNGDLRSLRRPNDAFCPTARKRANSKKQHEANAAVAALFAQRGGPTARAVIEVAHELRCRITSDVVSKAENICSQ